MKSALWIVVGCCMVLVAYAYVLYPAMLYVMSLRRRRRPPAHDGTNWPHVTITLPVYNEEAVIRRTLDGLLALDYPPDRRHILVISDASTDATNGIVAEYADRGVQLVVLPGRVGKTAAENASLPHLRGEIVVNTDASIRIPPNALKPLVAALSDPTVGVASGRDIATAGIAGDGTKGESGYVSYEMWVRDLETRVSGIVGASGCFFAARRALHGEIVPEALSRDFAAPLIAREHGYRSVSVPDAVCYVPIASSLRREYQRKVRTMTRGLETLAYKRHLLNPFRYGVFAWMLVSHKVLRWLVPWAFLVGLLSIAVLAWLPDAGWARVLLVGASVSTGLALAGWLWPEGRGRPRLLAIAAYFAAGMVAGVHAWVRALGHEMTPVWEPTRRGAP